MIEKEYYTLEELEDEFIGKIGTKKRDQYETEIEKIRIGEAIKQARIAHNLSQEELGVRLGVQKSRISRIEHGVNLSLDSIIRIFKSIGVSAKLDLANIGSFVLC
jgi:ribosome-binding protein aMBF1 (putative translation factor)